MNLIQNYGESVTIVLGSEELAVNREMISNLGNILCNKSNATISQTKLFDPRLIEQNFVGDHNSQ